jgi:quercetin dioxygenase-like cupin family protein
MKRFLAGTILLCASVVLSLRVAADEAKAHKDRIITPDMIKFAPGPPVLPSGFEKATLGGDMMKKGSEYTVRLRFPDGYKIPAHFHPGDEHVTVIQGTFLMGMGDKFDEASLKEMPAGSFHEIRKGVHHYAMSRGETVIQLHGVGAWGITYVNPADDPRKKAAQK